MKQRLTPVFCVLCVVHGPSAVRGGNYSLMPAVTGEAGAVGASAHYSAVLSAASGQTGSSANYSSRTGFPALIPDFTTRLSAPAAGVNEGATLKISAAEHYDDATLALLSPNAWSASGPASVNAAGLLTAAPVYQDTAVTVAAAGAALPLTVYETTPDNFPPYAADRLPDGWQVQYFGLTALNGGPQADFDSDSVDNLLEFAFGTHPASAASGLGNLQFTGNFAAGGTIAATGLHVTMVEPSFSGVDNRVLFVRRRDFAAVGLRYQPQYSADLTTWLTSSVTPTVLADDGVHQIVSVPYLNFIGGRKVRFFRMTVTFAP